VITMTTESVAHGDPLRTTNEPTTLQSVLRRASESNAPLVHADDRGVETVHSYRDLLTGA
jgi:hypothetical protein